MFFILKSDISILEALGYSLLGIAIVFAALLLLMAIIKIQSALMSKGKEKKPAAAKQYAALPEDVDEKLFDALRDVRTRIAARAGVPPYVIFSNATLADMAVKQPSSEFDLLSVRGVGDAKARRYGKEFLAAIQKYRDENLGK